MSIWKTMESAPTDGTHFLAKEKIGPMYEYDEYDNIIGYDIYDYKMVVVYYTFNSFITYPYVGSRPTNRKFTHWCHLPKDDD